MTATTGEGSVTQNAGEGSGTQNAGEGAVPKMRARGAVPKMRARGAVRLYLEALALDELLEAIEDEDVAILVNACQVAGAQPPIRRERLCSGLRPALVPEHDLARNEDAGWAQAGAHGSRHGWGRLGWVVRETGEREARASHLWALDTQLALSAGW